MRISLDTLQTNNPDSAKSRGNNFAQPVSNCEIIPFSSINWTRLCTVSRMRRITRAGKTGPRYINCYGAPIRDKKTPHVAGARGPRRRNEGNRKERRGEGIDDGKVLSAEIGGCRSRDSRRIIWRGFFPWFDLLWRVDRLSSPIYLDRPYAMHKKNRNTRKLHRIFVKDNCK